MYLIDTNIFLELFLGQSKAEQTFTFLKKVCEGKITAYISRFSLYSIEIILTRNEKITELQKFLDILRHAEGIKILNTDFTDDKLILENMKKWKLDFDDSIQYYLCKTHELTMVSFDDDFDATDLKRVEPQNV